MTPKQKQLVQISFAELAPLSEAAGQLFYARLFVLDPSLRALFKGDMKEQGRKLMRTLAIGVNGLDNLERMVPAMQEPAQRHVGYGIEPQHYDAVGEALLWTLQQGLGAAYTKEIAHAWASVYNLFANAIKEAVYGDQYAAMVCA